MMQCNVILFICRSPFLVYCLGVQTSLGTELHLQLIFCQYSLDPAAETRWDLVMYRSK